MLNFNISNEPTLVVCFLAHKFYLAPSYCLKIPKMNRLILNKSYTTEYKITDKILFLLALFLSLEFALQIFIFLGSNSQVTYLDVTGFLYFVLLVTIVARKKCSNSTKIYLVTFVTIGISLNSVLQNGINANYAIIALLLNLTLLTNRRYFFIVFGFVFILYFFITYNFITGNLLTINDFNQLYKTPIYWFISLGSFFGLVMLSFLVFGDLYKQIKISFEKKRYAEVKYRKLFEASNDAITLLKDGFFFDVNPKACEYFKIPKKEFIGKSVIEVSANKQYNGEDSVEAAQKVIGLAMSGKTQEFVWIHKKSNGELFDCVVTLSRIDLEDAIYVQGVIRDVTEQRKNERQLKELQNNLQLLVTKRTEELEKTTNKWKLVSEELTKKNNVVALQIVELNSALNKLKETQTQLFQADKMASLGVLTSGVSHEINNPLQYLSGIHMGFKNYFETYGSSDIETTDFLLNSTDTAITRISSIVKGLSEFSRQNDNLNEDCDLENIIENCLTILHSQYDNRISVVKNFSKKKFLVKGNVGKLHQLFTNLISNAIQAIENEGVISIKTELKKNNAYIEIADTGCGISKEHLGKITDPFFTTKNPGNGTGLGLSVSYTITKDHNGSLHFTSELHKGAKFEIILPIKL